MRFLSDIFTTPGFGGAIVVVAITALVVTYGLALRWISNGASHEAAAPPELDQGARVRSVSQKDQTEHHGYPGVDESSDDPNRPQAA